MITRIHGASSTLAANPRKKHRRAKRRNPSHMRKNAEGKPPRPQKTQAEKIAAAKRALAKLTGGYTAPKSKAVRAAERRATNEARKAAGLPPLKRRVKLSAEQIAKRQAAAVARAAAKATKDAQKSFRQQYGYALKALPAGASATNYVYYNKGLKKFIPSTRLIPKNKPKFTIYKTASGSYNLHRNPAIGKLVVAGVPVINMAIGSAATIFIGSVSKKLIAKFAPTVASSPIGDIAGELATAGVAAFVHGSKMKVFSNPMYKSIAQFAFIGAVFQILSKKATPLIEKGVDMIPGLSGYEGYTGGVYFDPYTESPAVGGAYLSADSGDMAGIYTSVDSGSAVGGLGLFNAPSIYG